MLSRRYQTLKQPIRGFRKHWFTVEAIPLYVAVGGMATAGLCFLLAKAATDPEVIWTRSNPTPWNTVAQNETYKTGNPLGPRRDASGMPQTEYERRWSRFESAKRAKEGDITDYKTQLNSPENRGGYPKDPGQAS